LTHRTIHRILKRLLKAGMDVARLNFSTAAMPII
jgi:pyruvate kinase